MLFEKTARTLVPALMLALACTSCESDNEGGPVPAPKVFWDTPVREMMSIAGPARRVKTQAVMPGESEPFILSSCEFDERGRLVKYDPVGLFTTFEYNIPTTASEYGYDAGGRLSTITVLDFGGEKTYTLTYGDHGNYVPLPLNMGDLRICLVKDLVGVTSSEGEELLVWENGMAVTETKSFTGTTRTELTFENGYPKQATSTGVSETTTLYSWNEDGSPAQTEESTPDSRIVTTFSTVAPGYPAVEEIYRPGEGGELLARLEYLYSDRGDLAKVWYPDSEKAGFTLQYEDDYLEFDTRGNWTGARRTYLDTGEQLELVRAIDYFE